MVFTSVFVALVVPVHGVLPKRQDPDMKAEDTVNIDLRDFLDRLDSLRRLNDPIVNTYIAAIRKAVEAGDYGTATELLRELQQYLNERYGDYVLAEDPGFAENLSIILSTENITGDSASINIVDFIEKYGSLVNSTSLIELAKKIKCNPTELSKSDLEMFYEIVSRLEKTSGGKLEFPEIPLELNESFNQIELPPIKGLPQLQKPGLSGSPVATASTPQPSSMDFISQLSIITLVSTVIILLIKYRSIISSVLHRSIGRVVYRTRDYIGALMGREIEDPVIRLCRRLLLYLRLHGYRREGYETLREFSMRISDPRAREIVLEATNVYEERVYGGRSIGGERIRRLQVLVNKLLRGFR